MKRELNEDLEGLGAMAFGRFNKKDHRPGAKGNRSETETSSPGSVHTLVGLRF